jgi:outer membrane protein TolC
MGSRAWLERFLRTEVRAPAWWRHQASHVRNYLALFLLLFVPIRSHAQTSNTYPIDLPTALQLAGAQNLDIKIARERLAEARATHESAVSQFFPWVAPGISYRQHNGKIQDVGGSIIDVNKYSYAPGATINAQVELGDAICKSLAARQLVRAADHAVESQRQDTALAAAQGYFDLAFAQSSVGVAAESLRISTNYDNQIQRAVEAGLAFKGDALRVRVQKARNQLALRQAIEQQRVAAARLAQVLRLDPMVELVPSDSDLAPLTLIETNTALDYIVQETLHSRPELKQNQALLASAKDTQTGAKYGPLIPTLGAQAFLGGLGGGHSGVSDSFGDSEDYLLSLSWRIGPGGLFDSSRIHSSDARLRVVQFTQEKIRDDVVRQAVEAFTHWQSAADQLVTVRNVLAAAEESLKLAEQRKEFAVGVVLETIQAEQDLTRARLDYLKTICEFNRAQYSLQKAMGRL